MRHSALENTGLRGREGVHHTGGGERRGGHVGRAEARGGTTITTIHGWFRAWQCVWAIRPTATILRVFRLVPGDQEWVSG